MSWFTDLFTSGAAKVVDSVTSGLDSLFTSDEERLQAKLLVEKEVNRYKEVLLQAQAQYDKEVTERWKSDNEHSITRLVRPVTYIFILVLFAGLVLFDGNIGEFVINPSYIPVIEGLLYTMTIAYFGSRGMEKIVKGKK